MNGNKALNLPHLIYDFAIYEIHRGWLHPAPTSFCLVPKNPNNLFSPPPNSPAPYDGMPVFFVYLQKL